MCKKCERLDLCGYCCIMYLSARHKRKAPTMTRYANPYFVRATIEFIGMTCYDAGDVKTIVKAFETKRDAWNYVQRLIEAYDRDCGGYDNEAYIVELKVQQNWKTLWQY